ncbi:hypothetical protein [Yersinia ruckeri]|uniref:hypothetical protein n=1 Tax=Yersinia ruckeri TaxID=29486 RepID=UPI0022385229|nr:hypothetical protein [Yersinia ruckeri]MCW6632923.1 hypothetical protein [Yersinia ruckeri]MCW6636915.1 hypothetical protein [Yersinia ruckeri]MCW6651444.1 hypothetical protein [Yersinia ruckeri]MCW6673136.1 hypothetical protein [Yersinia ruckeri]
MNTQHYLNKFNNKKSPERISLNYENAINYDMYCVYITHPQTGEDYLFKGYENKQIQADKWNNEKSRFDIPIILEPSAFTPDSFTGTYYYKAHQLNFTSLKDIVWRKELLFKFSAIKINGSQSRAKYRYRLQRQTIKNRMHVLDSVIGLHLEQKELGPVPMPLIMNKVYSNLWIYHDDSQKMLKELRLNLNAFVSSGDLRKTDDNNYLPEGKALLTQEKYSDEQTKYIETTKIQQKMLLTAIASCIAAFASVWAAFMTKG